MTCLGWLIWVTHGLRGWLASGDWKPSFDGVAAIVAGVIGFVAIIRQTRSSERSVTQQLQTEKKAREEEREVQKRTIAKAILFEIACFYWYFIKNMRAALDDRNGPLLPRSVEGVRFPVYEGNARPIGGFAEELGSDVARLYSLLRVYLDIQYELRFAHLQDSRSGEDGADWSRMAEDRTKELGNMLPCLTFYIYDVSERLCTLAGVPFKAPTIAVAELDRSQLVRDCQESQVSRITKPQDAQTH
ncbi:MAG: hypothetical protein ACRD2O_08150 [Terriglobia bacterium]